MPGSHAGLADVYNVGSGALLSRLLPPAPRPHRGVWPDPYGSLGILGNQRGAGAAVQNAHVPVSEAIPILQDVSVLQYWANAGRVCEAAAAYPLADGGNGRQGCRTVSQ